MPVEYLLCWYTVVMVIFLPSILSDDMVIYPGTEVGRPRGSVDAVSGDVSVFERADVILKKRWYKDPYYPETRPGGMLAAAQPLEQVLVVLEICRHGTATWR